MKTGKVAAMMAACLFAILLWPASLSAKETPLWEGITKNEKMLAADRQFVEAVKTYQKGDLKAGARHAIMRGWEAFGRQDYETAIRRFNQAWLLDSENPALYWGFALATYGRGDGLAVSERWFGEAEKRIGEDGPRAALFSDRGRVLDESGEPTRAKVYFEKSLAIDPDYVEAHVGMARVLGQLGDTAGAERHLKEVKRLKKG